MLLYHSSLILSTPSDYPHIRYRKNTFQHVSFALCNIYASVVIDAHFLCAEDHLPYQGRQYSMKEFADLQGRLPRKIGQYNCKHMAVPILLGAPPAYSEETLEEMRRNSAEKIEIDGRTMSRYEWTQEQRRIETAVRYQKDRGVLATHAGNMEIRRDAQGKINALMVRYEKISEKAGLHERRSRTYVEGFEHVKLKDRKIPSAQERERLKSYYPKDVQLNALDAPGYVEKFKSITDNEAVDQSIYECAVKALTHRAGTAGEDLYLINGKTGKILHANTTSKGKCTVNYDAATTEAIRKAHSRGIPIIALHNHPNGMPPSIDDGSSAYARGYDMGIVAGHNLEVFTYSKADRMYSEKQCEFLHERLVSAIRFEFDFNEERWYTYLKKFGMEVSRR